MKLIFKISISALLFSFCVALIDTSLLKQQFEFVNYITAASILLFAITMILLLGKSIKILFSGTEMIEELDKTFLLILLLLFNFMFGFIFIYFCTVKKIDIEQLQ